MADIIAKGNHILRGNCDESDKSDFGSGFYADVHRGM